MGSFARGEQHALSDLDVGRQVRPERGQRQPHPGEHDGDHGGRPHHPAAPHAHLRSAPTLLAA
ncbi:hypothetical protein ACWDUH_23690 [Micromonospora wenchangensis]